HVITRRRLSQITQALAVVRDNVSKLSVHNSRTSGNSVNAKIFPHCGLNQDDEALNGKVTTAENILRKCVMFKLIRKKDHIFTFYERFLFLSVIS
uniref:hypothetical protein n=1 Tax=Cronobacter sakazakii TaxID=28141 RepID=UPI0020CB1BB8